MKSSSAVSKSSRKSRKAHFSAPSHIRRKLMSSHLSKDLKNKHKVRSLPIHKDDEIRIKRGGGAFKDKTGKVIAVYRKKWCIHVEKFTKEKANGQSVQIPIHPSNCQIVNLKLNEARKKIINRKVESAKGKVQRADID